MACWFPFAGPTLAVAVVIQTSSSMPDIAVEQPVGTGMADGTGSVDFGTVTLGSLGLVKTFTIRNPGTADLSGLAISKDGTDAGDFTVGAPGTTTVVPGGSTTFTVTFTPGAAGARSAAIHIASNVTGARNPFDISLAGTGYMDTSPGSVDALNAAVNGPAGSSVYAMAVQPDGKMILGGKFTSVLGVARNYLARLNADGSLDSVFDPNLNDYVISVVVQPDGKILVMGNFTTLQPNGAPGATTRNYIARLNADGSVDPSFDPNANNRVFSVALQADGKILMWGEFTTLQPNGAPTATARQRTARLNPDGSLDAGFELRPNVFVESVAVQEDGKIVVVGNFTTLQPNGAPSATTRNRIARINADGTLDVGFDPNANNTVIGVAMQADGRILVAGGFTALQPNGAPGATIRNRMARLNGDGTLDTGFDPNVNNVVYSVVVQADGGILIGGGFQSLQPIGAASPMVRNNMARLNADGSLDPAFDPNANSNLLGVALQADGKILIGGGFDKLQPNGAATPTSRKYFARLNSDAASQTVSVPDASQVVWLRGGTAPEVTQVTVELSDDGGTTWTPLGNGTRVGSTANWQLNGLTLPTSGWLRVRGSSPGAYVNGSAGLVESVAAYSLPAPDIAVEQTAGTGLADGTSSVDFGTVTLGSLGLVKTFTIRNPGTADLTGLAITVDGANAADFSVGAPGSTTVTPGGSTTFNVTFTPGGSGLSSAAIHIASNVSGSRNPFDISLAGTGYLDTSPGSVDPLDLQIIGSSVVSMAVQPDGKTIVVGNFTSMLGVSRNHIARVNADGSLDVGFDPNANGEAYGAWVQTDGRILVSGAFTTLQPNGAATPTTRHRIARLNADGSVDPTFDPNADSRVFSAAVQADGRILLWGDFTALQPNGAAGPTTRNRIARLNPDGSLDTGFDPNANHWVFSVVELSDGRILIGGLFTALQPNGAATPTSINRIARLNADGTIDPTYDPNANNAVQCVVVQADGKLLITGNFTSLQPNGAATPTLRNNVARLNPDGSLDPGFDPNANGIVHGVAVQADGRILIGGRFTALQPNGAATPTTRNRIARLNGDGTLDPGFDPNANSWIWNLALQSDGKALLGGIFTTLRPNGAATPTTRNLFAQLNNNAATQVLSAPDASQVSWQRGGAAPAVSKVTFELSIDGGTLWTPLGEGTRVGTTANWQLTGLGLPISGQIRARGRTAEGYINGCAGLVESIATYTFTAPEIAVSGNNTDIADGVSTPSLADHTDFGNTPVVGGTVVRTFTIANVGTGDLTVGAVSIGGTHATDFAVTSTPTSPVTPGNSTTFQVTFAPSAPGLRNATISFSNNDGDENPFDFAIQGTGLAPTFTVSGNLWHDNGAGLGTAGDGVKNGGEPNLPTVTVQLSVDEDGAGPNPPIVYPVVTDPNGNYQLNGVPGSALVVITVDTTTLPSPAYVPTGDPDAVKDSQNTFTMAGADVSGKDFGYREVLASVAGTVVARANGNGLAEPGETPVPSVSVTLRYYGADGIPGTPDDVVTSVNTDGMGDYLFTGLLPGLYEITKSNPTGYISLADRDGGTPDRITMNLAAGNGVTGVGDNKVDEDFELQLTESDVTSVITAVPNVMHGVTHFYITVRVTELNVVNTSGQITVRIPKDIRWVLDGPYNPTLTMLGSTTLNNSSWAYSEDATHHIFQSTTVIAAGSFSYFGFLAVWDAGQTKGKYTITAQIDSGSGGEIRGDNNVDAEKLDYFLQ